MGDAIPIVTLFYIHSFGYRLTFVHSSPAIYYLWNSRPWFSCLLMVISGKYGITIGVILVKYWWWCSFLTGSDYANGEGQTVGGSDAEEFIVLKAWPLKAGRTDDAWEEIVLSLWWKWKLTVEGVPCVCDDTLLSPVTLPQPVMRYSSRCWFPVEAEWWLPVGLTRGHCYGLPVDAYCCSITAMPELSACCWWSHYSPVLPVLRWYRICLSTVWWWVYITILHYWIAFLNFRCISVVFTLRLLWYVCYSTVFSLPDLFWCRSCWDTFWCWFVTRTWRWPLFIDGVPLHTLFLFLVAFLRRFSTMECPLWYSLYRFPSALPLFCSFDSFGAVTDCSIQDDCRYSGDCWFPADVDAAVLRPGSLVISPVYVTGGAVTYDYLLVFSEFTWLFILGGIITVYDHTFCWLHLFCILYCICYTGGRW